MIIFGSGSANLSPDEEWLVIDNLTTGCELYQFPQTSPVEAFPVPRSRSYVHEAIFLQHGGVIACGSDSGRIHIFCTETAKKIQTLRHGSRTSMVQVLSVRLPISFSHQADDGSTRAARRKENTCLQVGLVILNQ